MAACSGRSTCPGSPASSRPPLLPWWPAAASALRLRAGPPPRARARAPAPARGRLLVGLSDGLRVRPIARGGTGRRRSPERPMDRQPSCCATVVRVQGKCVGWSVRSDVLASLYRGQSPGHGRSSWTGCRAQRDWAGACPAVTWLLDIERRLGAQASSSRRIATTS